MKSSDWISVKDRLPKIGMRVMACQSFNDGSTFTRMATRVKINQTNRWYDDEGFNIEYITHWQGIVLPKKETNETPTEKLLPQGLQDWLNAKRECMAQANDIHNEIIDREMRTLHLPLKKEWYEMIESGVKTEEYREIKQYWTERLTYVSAIDFEGEHLHSVVKHFDYVKFSYGYTKRTMTFEIESITIGKGNPEWGAPNEDVFIIKLGKRIK